MKTIKTLMTAIACAVTLHAGAQTYVGGDISLLPSYEDHGAKYYDHNGTAISSPLEFFKQEGLNAMRVRLFVDPSNASSTEQGEGVVQDLDYVTSLSKRIKAAGFKLLLDFHYSDTWADPSKQWTPKAWLSLSDADLGNQLYTYTKEVLNHLKSENAAPDFIQTGNEISYGMLWGAENTTANHCWMGDSYNATSWNRFTTLLKQAGKACREVCPDAKIVLHTERVAQVNVLKSFYEEMNSANVDYDIIGLSYYPPYHGSLSTLNMAVNNMEIAFPEKNIMIVETGYPYAWEMNGTTYDYTGTYPYSDEGQRQFTQDLITTLKKHSNVIGLFWWWMEANENGLDWSTQRVTTGWNNTSLFDNRDGKATSALSELKAFAEDANAIHSAHTTTTKADQWYTLQGQAISRPSQKGVYINNGKKVVVR